VAKIIAPNAQTNSNGKPLKQVVVAGVIDETAQGKGDQKLTVNATITDLNTRTMRDEQPTPTSESSVIPPVAQSPVALGELLLTGAVQFHASIDGDVINEPERVLELVQRVRDIVSEVTMAVREQCPL